MSRARENSVSGDSMSNFGPAPHGLFDGEGAEQSHCERIATGAKVLRGFAGAGAELMGAVEEVVAISPFRYMPVRGGRRMSVGMTNCGTLGWVSDETGYRYDTIDPATGRRWPAMPALFMQLAREAAAAAGFANFLPDACLVNRYAPGAQMGLHQDRDERDLDAPIVSVSLGLPAVFLFGGMQRSVRPQRIALESGDVAVWGGPSRLAYHGVAKLADGNHPLTGRCRVNLTFRKAG
jgi:DNA oxidative demethylase